MGDQPRRRRVDARVAVQERRERPEQVGLVLLVVGDEWAHRLGVEAPELARVTHVGQQQLVGAGVVEGELGPLGVPLDDVRRQQRLVAGAMEVEQVLDTSLNARS